jgi:hypothetical protein
MRYARDYWKVWECLFDYMGLFSLADSFCDYIYAAYRDRVLPGIVNMLEVLTSCFDLAWIFEKCPLCLEFNVRSERLYKLYVGGYLE